MSQIENMITLHESAEILLIIPQVSALKTLAKNNILNIAPWATVSDKNVKCKQNENRAPKGEKSHQSYF